MRNSTRSVVAVMALGAVVIAAAAGTSAVAATTPTKPPGYKRVFTDPIPIPSSQFDFGGEATCPLGTVPWGGGAGFSGGFAGHGENINSSAPAGNQLAGPLQQQRPDPERPLCGRGDLRQAAGRLHGGVLDGRQPRPLPVRCGGNLPDRHGAPERRGPVDRRHGRRAAAERLPAGPAQVQGGDVERLERRPAAERVCGVREAASSLLDHQLHQHRSGRPGR